MISKAAVVLAAGQGTRMRSRVPKVLHPLCGKIMVAHVVDTTRNAGVTDIVVVVPPDSMAIREALGDSVRYAVQQSPLGSGDALLSARDSLPRVGEVAVLSGDVPLVPSDSLLQMQSGHASASAKVTLLTARVDDPSGLGRIVRGRDGAVRAIVEHADADAGTRAIDEINTGIYIFDADWLWEGLRDVSPSASGEVYVTDLIEMAAKNGVPVADVMASSAIDVMGVNDRVQLARAEATLRARIRERWMLDGVTMPDPDAVYIDAAVVLARDTVVMPNTHLLGATTIGEGCEMGPNSVVVDSVIADNCRVVSSFVAGSRLSEGVSVGPFSNVRDGTVLEEGVRVGNFTETKQSRLGARTRALHLSYVGDADVGADVNIGAGTITCNFDGERKSRTTIGDGVFIGSDTMLVAPVELGAGASTGAGSVVTRDVPSGELAVGAPARVIKRKKRKQNGKEH